jgi:hypothetical protein
MTFYSRKTKPIFLASLFGAAILCVLVFSLPSGYGGYATAQTCVQPPSDMIAWWPLDETSGTIAMDIVGNKSGAYFGGPTPIAGKVQGALQFDGVNDFVSVTDSDLWAFGNSDFTVELWAYFNSPGGGSVSHPSHIFIGNDEGPFTVNKWFFSLGGGVLGFVFSSPTIGDQFLTFDPFAPNLNQWYHLSIRRQGNTFTAFVNGLPAGSVINTLAIPNPNAPLTIGQAESLGFVNGRLDEVTIYNRALSSSEIQAIYNAGSAGKCKPQPPPPPTTCSKIVFDTTRHGDDNTEIYVMNADGANQTRLTNNMKHDYRASFSPDGSKIAFGSDRDGNFEIYVMNADGTNQTRLTNNPAKDEIPNFSPDGSKIAFESNRDGNTEIYVMNADGTNQTRLTNNPARDGNPAFSPDGSKIVFESFRDGNEEVYVMNTDGTNQTRLTNNPAGDSGDPFFSPDGSKIAFETNRDGNLEIYVMNADGTNQTRLTNNPANDTDPFFSPDGSKIAFETSRAGVGNYEVYVMNADGTAQTNLTNSPAHDFSPSWTGCKTNRPPNFFGLTAITRVNGAPAKRSVIARVRDAETPAGDLIVAVFAASPFISVTNLTNDNGTISADVAILCIPLPGLSTVVLQVTDGNGQFGFGFLRVNVTEATLSYSSPIPVSFNSGRVVTPDTLPEGFASFAVSAPNFRGDISVDQTTGIVTISRARSTGSYTVTVTATNFCGIVFTRSFTLMVANGNTEYQGAVGEPVPTGAPGQVSKGSILLFNLYSSGSGGENTSITLANRNATLRTMLHLFFVANDGSIADTFLCIPADSSTSFLVSNVDPGGRGYLIAIAVDATSGSPTSFNHLTGKEDIRLASGHSATDVRAESFQALFPEGTSLPIVADTATINFDGISYSRAARTLLLEDVPSPADGNETILVFNHIGGNLNSGVSPIGGFRGVLYEKGAPENFNPFIATAAQAQFFSTLSDSFPLTTPSFSQLLSSGKDWRMVFHASNDIGLSGLALNRGPVKLNKSLLNPLALTRAASLTVPVFPVPVSTGCQ